MKFYLIDKIKIDLKPPHNNQDRCFLISACITPHSSNNEIPKELSNFKKFKHVFEQKYGILLESSPLSIDFQVSSENSETPTTSWNIIVHGEILRALHEVVCCGSGNDLLQIRLTVQRSTQQDSWNRSYDSITVVAEDLIPQFELEGPCLHNRYEQANVKIPAISTPNHGYPVEWHVSLEVTKENFICLAEITPKFSETNRKILEEGKFCDFEIIVEDSNPKSIPCHKTFLCANSPVFSRMLEGNFGEASENKMKMEGISVDGVNALLKFLYYSDVTDVIESSVVALELYRAADKYDIQPLLRVISAILLEQTHAWYDVDMALGLFEFLRNCELDGGNLILRKKVIQVLALKSEQLPKSKLYKEIFSNPAARDMFSLSLATNKP